MNLLALREDLKTEKKYHTLKCFKKRGKDKTLVFITSLLDIINHWYPLRSDWLPFVRFVHK